MKRAHLLVLSATVSTVGWGTVLPYQYAYAADTRGWGGLVAASASSLFSIGALVAAPLCGRLADRHSPVRVAVLARLAAVLVALSLVVAGTPLTFLAGMLALGVAVTAGTPAQQVLALRWVEADQRRRVFALMFSGQALGMAIGAFAAGHLVDLHRSDGMTWAFLLAALGFLLAAVLLLAAGPSRGSCDVAAGPSRGSCDVAAGPSRGSCDVAAGPSRGSCDVAAGPSRGSCAPDTPSVGQACDLEPITARVGTMELIRLILASPPLRWTAVITVTLALGFYAQFESGLPAYAITVLGAPAETVGTAAAVNCVVIIALQMLVVRFTARRSAPNLLIVVGSIWVSSWLLLAGAGPLPGQASVVFIAVYGLFGIGETMYAPVLNPLTASLAPAGTVGTTLGFFAALQTGVSAAGPLLAGLALGAGHSALFVVAHLLISAVAVYAAWRLRALLRVPRGSAAATSQDPRGSAVELPAAEVERPAEVALAS